MRMRFRDDVTESEIRSVMDKHPSEDEQMLGFGCYSRIDFKDIYKNLIALIFCPLAIPIQVNLAILMLNDAIKIYSQPTALSPLEILISVIGGFMTLVFLFIPVGLIIAVVVNVKEIKNARYTIYYAYSANKLFVMKNDDYTRVYDLSGFEYISAKDHVRYGKVYAKPLKSTRFLPLFLLYVEDAVKFCNSISVNPDLKIYLNNKDYT